MRVLVTGGAGFIGSNYVRRVVDGSLTGISKLTVLDKLTYAGTLTNLEMLPSDSFEFVQNSNAVDSSQTSIDNSTNEIRAYKACTASNKQAHG